MKVHKCNLCFKTFDSFLKKTLHTKSCKSRKVYQCEICNLRFPTKGTLETHKKLNHPVKKAVKKFHCDMCDVKFTRPYGLKMHKMAVHTRNGGKRASLFHCNLCNSYQTDLPSYQMHLLTKHKLQTEKHIDVFTKICNTTLFKECGETYLAQLSDMSTFSQLRLNEKIIEAMISLLKFKLLEKGHIKFSFILTALMRKEGPDGTVIKSVFFPLRAKWLELNPSKTMFIESMLKYSLSMAENRCEDLGLSGSGWMLCYLQSISLEICECQSSASI